MNWPDAINQLPEHEPQLDAWDRLEADPRLQDLRAETALDLLLKKLPQHSPEADVWSRIDIQLTAEETLDRGLANLPQHEPRTDMWDALSAKLTPEPAPETVVMPLPGRSQPRHIMFSRGQWAAAASVVLCLLGGYWFYQNGHSAETITVAYSVETAPVTVSETATDRSADEHLEAFINQACEQQVVACKKPQVQDLRQQLADLDVRKIQIDKQLTVFGEDPDLVKAQIRIENERADVTKELVRILRI
ncbi:hypothetical protein [Fibrella aquatilis]|uniref:Anti-sigma factor n=1 Tax=Fibrella aquatilis TaxID=2817059 RepID=A0A939G7W5_9BACT|nr:hypothetical protein [Fibrella aquatilis]MBO0932833.1 hypothetical protein [Fibrella aquatilis]